MQDVIRGAHCEYVAVVWLQGVYKAVDISKLYDMIMIHYSMIQEDKEALAFMSGTRRRSSTESLDRYRWGSIFFLVVSMSQLKNRSCA